MPNPPARLRLTPSLLLLAALAGDATPQTLGTAFPTSPPVPPEASAQADDPAGADIGIPWLQEVRAQRQALEARRQANRAAFAAQREAREDRREARRARLEQDWAELQALHPPLTDPPRTPDTGRTPATGPLGPAPAPPAPPDWNNLWYFRGY